MNRRVFKRVGATFAAVLVTACGADAPAQSVTDGNHSVDESAPVALELTATFPESFGLVTNVREMGDGALLVADPLSKVLLRVDMEAGTSDTLGSEGPGPDEYRQPDVVYELAGERSVLVDLGNARFTEIEADDSFGQTYPLASGSPMDPGSFEMKLPNGIDQQGRVYYRGRLMTMNGDPPTEAPIRRWDPATNSTEDLAQIALPAVEVQRSGGADNQSVNISQIPLAAQDEWAVGPDGRIAIARHTPFRLDWVDPDGTVTSGPEVTYDPVSIGTDEKLEWLERRSVDGGGISVSVEVDNDRARTTFQRGGSQRGEREINAYTWPEDKGAAESVIVASNGMAWVRRSREAGASAHYDLFDAQGRVTGSVELEGRRRVITVTDQAVYVVHLDEFDLQYLERYRLPS